MNLRQLRYAAALAEAKSFTKAADNEFVVQSALSQQLRKLEDELGVALFERTTRSVALTPAGEALLPLIHQVLAGVDRIKFDAQALSGTIAGRLTVGMMEVPSESLDVAVLMATFHARYPEVTVTLRSGGSNLLIEAVRDRKLDVADLEPGAGLKRPEYAGNHHRAVDRRAVGCPAGSGSDRQAEAARGRSRRRGSQRAAAMRDADEAPTRPRRHAAGARSLFRVWQTSSTSATGEALPA